MYVFACVCSHFVPCGDHLLVIVSGFTTCEECAGQYITLVTRVNIWKSLGTGHHERESDSISALCGGNVLREAFEQFH